MESIYQRYYSPEGQRAIYCIGRNYVAHAHELKNEIPTSPMWFDKPMSSLLLPGEPFVMKPQYGEIHHELELGVVIGMPGRHIRVEDALKHIGGYFVGIDFTNRSLQTVNKQLKQDWCCSKGA